MPETETATAVSTPPSAARTLLPGTAMIAVTFGLSRYGYGLLLPDMRAEVQMTASTAGLISSAAYLSYMAANIGVVAVSDGGDRAWPSEEPHSSPLSGWASSQVRSRWRSSPSG